MNVIRFSRTVCCAMLSLRLLAQSVAVHAGATSTNTLTGVLHLTNGGFVQGRLLDGPSPDWLEWQGTQFTSPFRFSLNHVHSVMYAPPTELPMPQGEFCFEIGGGGVLFGQLLGVTEEAIEIQEAKFGRIAIRKDRLHRMFRWEKDSELVFSGPTGFSGLELDSKNSKAWLDEGGELFTSQTGARIATDISMPTQIKVEFELSWKQTPNFIVALGGAPKPDSKDEAFRFEIIESELVAVRESKQDADITFVTPVAPHEGHLHLVVYVDKERGDLFVYTVTGEKLAELHVAGATPRLDGGVSLINIRGDLRLQRLRVTRWNGIPPTVSEGAQPQVQLENGTVNHRRLKGYDPQSQQLIFHDGDQEMRIPLAQIKDMTLPQTAEKPQAGGSPSTQESSDPQPPEQPSNSEKKPEPKQDSNADPATDEKAPPLAQLVYHDGTRLTGTVTKVSATEIGLNSPDIVEPLSVPVQDLRGMTLLNRAVSLKALSVRMETLELTDAKLRGRLVDGQAQPDSSCLTWKPEFSETASPLQAEVSGRIVYKTPPKRSTVRTNKVPSARVRGAVAQGVAVIETDQQEEARKKTSSHNRDVRYLHLRSGDTIPCEVKSIDEKGITFETPMSDATFVSHDKIKAVELMKSSSTLKLSKQKRERLLMLPRMQRDSPPTQLICSRNGDLLRGRILSMDDATLTVEVRLDNRKLARDRIAEIIWLHNDELNDETITKQAADSEDTQKSEVSPAEPATSPTGTRVQAQRSDGIRLTFWADLFAERSLSGKSDLLGECRTDVTQVDQLLIGQAIELAAANLPYHRWKLHHAIDPKYIQEENSEGEEGQDSPLVGKPAPDFKLDFLDGTQFHLADCKGQIVVLDFWATWCGPCLQVMPQVEEVVSEFDGQNLRLVAVNLEETPKQILATLERHKLNVPVVLDQDGVVAHRYNATAIPQTVIIDREGKVVRVFIGGGPDYGDQLREALKQVLGETPEKPSGDSTQDPPSDETSPPKANS